MSDPATTRRRSKSAAGEACESLDEFLLRELPPGKTQQAAHVVNTVTAAGIRYDVYNARRSEWLVYAARRQRLIRIARLALDLASELCSLDVLSRDKLACPTEPKHVEAQVGALAILSSEATTIAGGIQEYGRPRDLAEEGWILEMAEIYENAFCRPPTISGSGNEPAKRRGKFYNFLQLGLPSSFFPYGKLSVRQVRRALDQRKKPGPLVIGGAATSDPREQSPANGPLSSAIASEQPSNQSQP